jgi:hypothetical protein
MGRFPIKYIHLGFFIIKVARLNQVQPLFTLKFTCSTTQKSQSCLAFCALLKMIATGMSLPGNVTGCMAEEQNHDFHRCRGNRRKSSLFVEENDYSAIFHSGANNLLAFWLYLVVSSYFVLNKKVNFFGSCRV